MTEGETKVRGPRKEMTDEALEVHVIKNVGAWLSKLRPASRKRVVTFVVDRAEQTDREERAAAAAAAPQAAPSTPWGV
jgi:hypothetical protein